MSTEDLTGNRVLVIGLDGATFRVLGPLIEAGLMPNLKRLMHEGASGTLLSTVPPNSAAAWTTFITGKNPGKHGIFHFVSLGWQLDVERAEEAVEVSPGAFAVVNANSIKDATLWQMVGDAGKHLVVVNVPMTYPPRPVNGVMITSLLTPPGAGQFTYPPEVGEELEEYEIELARSEWASLSEVQIIERLIETTDKRGRTALRLMMQEPWDMFMVVFTETDRVQHRFWNYLCPTAEGYSSSEADKYRPALDSFYANLDDWIGRLVKEAGPEVSVVIMSDHGFTGQARRRVYVQALAQELGLFTMHKASWAGRLRAFVESTMGLRYERVYRILIKVVPGKLLVRLLGFLRGEERRALGSQRGRITKLQQAVGAVSLNREQPGEHDASVLKHLRERLERLRDPMDGREVVRKVSTRDEIYSGRFTEELPPLIFFLEDGYGLTSGTGRHGRVFERQLTAPMLQGVHAPDGILMLHGPHIRQREFAGQPLIQDVTATILYLLGLSISEDLDGRVLSETLDPEFWAAHPVEHVRATGAGRAEDSVSDYSREDAEAIEKRLRGLGYID